MQKNDLNLTDFLIVLWKKKILLSSVTFIGAAIGIIFSLTLPNIYYSEAILIPAEHNQSSNNMMSQYSGLAGLAGISLPMSMNENKTEEAIKIVQSYDFFSNYFLPLIKLEDLMAVKKWNPNDNQLSYNKSDFDSINKKWVRTVSFPYSVIPSDQEAYEKYINIMSIEQERKSTFIKLSFSHKSPHLAKEWTSIVISEINRIMREKDKQKASKSIEFLNSQSSKVSYDEVRQALSMLLQDQIKSLMLIEANDDYVFEIIDSPIVPEKKSEPSRSQIVLLITFISLFFGILFVLFNHYGSIYFKENQEE